MADQSGSSCFQKLFESALQDYEKKTGITLTQHPLAVRLRSCQSVEDITTLLQSQVQGVGCLQASDKMMKSIERTLSILNPLSAAASLSTDMASPKALRAGSESDRFFFHFCRPYNPRKRYRLVSVSYSMYVPFPSPHVGILVTSKRTRRPTASFPVVTHSPTCLNRSNYSSTVSTYIRGSLLRPQ